MGRKKDKGKNPMPDSPSKDSPTKALSEHSEDLPKTLKSKDFKKWIEELSQSPEVLKALQSMASSSTEESGMASKPKAIVPSWYGYSVSNGRQ